MTNEPLGVRHMSLPSIEQLDVDGAIREADAAVAGDTRASFFRKAAVGGGAVLTSGAIMGMLPDMAAAAKPSRKNDLKILNFALTLEYLEAAFYKEAIQKNALSGDVLALTKLVADHEVTHVSALRGAIKQAGAKPVQKPEFDFMDTTGEEKLFLDTSYDLENTGIHAYLGQAGNLKSKKYLGTAATIVTIEARHAAAFATLRGDSPFDVAGNSITPAGAFDRGFSKKHILKIVGDTNFIKGS